MNWSFWTGVGVGFIGGTLLFFGLAVWITLSANRRAKR